MCTYKIKCIYVIYSILLYYKICVERDRKNKCGKNVKKLVHQSKRYIGFSVYATFLCNCYYFRNKKFTKYVLFKSLIDVSNYTPRRLNRFVFSQYRGRVGAAVGCSYFYSAILMAGTSLMGSYIRFDLGTFWFYSQFFCEYSESTKKVIVE